MKTPRVARFNNREYEVVNPPSADTDDLAKKGDRLIFHHLRICQGSELITARKGVLTAGWVLGVFIE